MPNLAEPDTIRDKRSLISLHAAHIKGNKEGRREWVKEMEREIGNVRLIERQIC